MDSGEYLGIDTVMEINLFLIWNVDNVKWMLGM
jgi:hypothetical protein